jgi:hypothetical protein
MLLRTKNEKKAPPTMSTIKAIKVPLKIIILKGVIIKNQNTRDIIMAK